MPRLCVLLKRLRALPSSFAGAGDGGTVFDLSASGLDRVDGLGNEFKIKWSGSAKRVIYPGGGTTYNLAPGTQLWVDGRLQSAGNASPAK